MRAGARKIYFYKPMQNNNMPTAFEEKTEDEEVKKKKKPEAKAPERKAPEFKAPELKGPEAIKTLMEIREIRETAKKGREIIARKKGEQIEPKEEERDVKHKDMDIKSMLEPPPAPPKPPSKLLSKPIALKVVQKTSAPKLSSLKALESKPSQENEEERKKRRRNFLK